MAHNLRTFINKSVLKLLILRPTSNLNFSKEALMRLLLSQIRTDGGTQARAEINQITVIEYATAIREGQTFPPVVVFFDGDFYWLVDGFHRLEAYRLAEIQDDLEVILKLGTLRDAILYAVGANAEHGLRRTTADKHHAVSLLLSDPQWGQWSDRMIAKQTFTSAPFVAKVRSLQTINANTERVYTTKHGSQSSMDTSGIGKVKKYHTLQLQLNVWEKLQQYQEKMGLDSISASITKLLALDTNIAPAPSNVSATPTTMKRWIGFDPGLAVVRWAVLEGKETGYDLPKILGYGIVETTKKRPTSERLCELEQDLVTLLRQFQPNNVAMEIPFMGENPKTTRNVLEAAGVIQLVCYREGGIIPIHLYPSMWKAHIGFRKADNEEVTDTLSALFELNGVGKSRLDAIGIAYAAFCGVKVVDRG